MSSSPVGESPGDESPTPPPPAVPTPIPIGSFIASWAPRVAGTAAATSPRARVSLSLLTRSFHPLPHVHRGRASLPGSPSSATARG